MHRPTVILADDHDGILTVASMLLGGEFEIVATAADGAAAVRAALELQPDLVILDITMSGTGGIQAARQLQQLGLALRIIFLTVQDDTDYVDAAWKMGASYVLKPRMYSDLVTAVKETLAGRTFFSVPLHPLGSATL